MSVFTVKLNNTVQGVLDIDPVTGLEFTTSKQRSMYVAGPNRSYRKLNDGDTFTDCNYWKRFAYPQVALDQAFIVVTTDDGSVYSDVPGENTYVLAFGGDTAYNVLSSDTYTTNLIDIIGTYGSYATYVQVQNLGTDTTNQNIKVKLNGSATAIFTLKAGDSQIFNPGDLLVSSLGFTGGVATTPIQVILGVRTVCNS